MTNRPSIPENLKRLVRQESNFGCAKCGCPIIDYHHIIPYHKVKTHNLENIIALCPTCHRRANEKGGWDISFVKNLKLNPFNKAIAKDYFVVTDNSFLIKVGKLEFHNFGHLIALDNQIVLSLVKDQNNRINISGIFYDSHGNMVAKITDNEWIAYTNQIWDIEYSLGSKLIIRSGKRNIILRIKLEPSFLHIQQCFFIKDHLRFRLIGNNRNSKLSINATNTYFSSKNETMIFKMWGSGPALTLKQ